MKTTEKTSGLRYWMLRVLEECDKVSSDFSADPVHDLRVALRRCRSMADGMIAMDPDRNWKAMKKAGKQLFQQLGALRDVQIMMDWIERLDFRTSEQEWTKTSEGAGGSPEATPSEVLPDPVAALGHILRARELQHKHEARAALEQFDRKRWRQWSKTLPQRAARIPKGSPLFKHLALERWMTARELHRRAMRSQSQVALHALRIGIKRFRYIVENFLPVEHKAWSNDLKHMQDLLGEVHDLDVLWATAQASGILADEAVRKTWHARIAEERSKRVNEYREKMTGPASLWNLWRAGLPQGKQIQAIATRRMKLWAKALDPDFAHSERVTRLALQLYDGLTATGLLNGRGAVHSLFKNGAGADARGSLYAAAMLHDIGKARDLKAHHKATLEMMQKHGAPLGWKAETMARAGIVARFHCGALPTRSHPLLHDLLPDEQRTVIQLAAMLRLANAMDSAHDGRIRNARIVVPDLRRRTNGFARKPLALGKNEALVIAAEGYSDGTPTARAIAAERHLLETVLRRPVIVRPASGSRRRAAGPQKTAAV